MAMLKKFLENIKSSELFNPEDRILLTVSGGIDSMVMARLFMEAGFNYGIAHCNFQLRGTDADSDEKLVEEYAAAYNLPYYLVKFNTKEYARTKGISIQMAARELRYDWFEKIRSENGYKYIAVAHNSDDVIETILNNLIRGTGIRGLTGIKEKNDSIIRPVLVFSREKIEKYQKENNIPYREDKSNQSLKYSRNRLRHVVIPELEKINPGFREGIIETAAYIAGAEQIFTKAIKARKNEVLSKEHDLIKIDKKALLKLNNIATYLYEFIREFAFPKESIPKILSKLEDPGKQFFSQTHRLLIDRRYILITRIKKDESREYDIYENTKRLTEPIQLALSTEDINPGFKPGSSRNIAFLNHSKLSFPLRLRKWKNGDRFMPLGLNNMKKLSDFFIDEKLSLIDKENTWILLSGNKIAWIVGHRIDNRFRITEDSRRILKIELSI